MRNSSLMERGGKSDVFLVLAFGYVVADEFDQGFWNRSRAGTKTW
jgi:hypothetical protein